MINMYLNKTLVYFSAENNKIKINCVLNLFNVKT